MSKKLRKKGLVCATITLAIFIEQLKCLEPYQNPQVINTKPFSFERALQIPKTTTFIVQVKDGGLGRLYTYNVMASDFPTVHYVQSLVPALNSIKRIAIHSENPNVIFAVKKHLYVCDMFSILKISTEAGEILHALKFLSGTNFVFTGGEGSKRHRFDYTSDPLTPQATGTFSDNKALEVNLLENDQPSIETAWALEPKTTVEFVDRTSNLNTALRTYRDTTNQIVPVLEQFLTPKKLAIMEKYGEDMGVIDYSQTAITRDYWARPCGNGVRPYFLAPVDQSTKGVVVCRNQYLKLVDLTDGAQIKSLDVSAVHSKGRFARVLAGKRILLASGETSTAGTFTMSLWDIRDERPCQSSCATCEFDATSTGCTSCPAGKILRLDGSCGDSCLQSDEYVDNSKKCQKCDPSCPTCFGGGPNNCSSCPDPKFKSADNSCKDSCASNEYNSGSRICKACHPSCLTCEGEGPTNCVRCPFGKFMRTDNSCQDSCASHEFNFGTSSCGACHQTCLTCNGPLESHCSTCDSLSYYKLIDERWCRACRRETCPRCLQGSLCERCLENPNLEGCGRMMIDYSISLEIRGVISEGDLEIYLMIQLNSTDLELEDMKFLVDYEHFLVETSSIESIGTASYDKLTGRLLERGKVSKNLANNQTIEYLVYKAPQVPESAKMFKLKVF